MSNSDNPKNGALFQSQVKEWFQKKYHKPFELEKKIPIGIPAKDHKFDIVDSENTIAIECKRYTWTETGNVPSAKMGFVNEAAFYLSFLPESYVKVIVMLDSYHEKRKETLAEYYYRTYHHLLGDILIAEYDPIMDNMRFIGNKNQGPRDEDRSVEGHKETLFSEEDLEGALLHLSGRKRDIEKYHELQSRAQSVNVEEDRSFQRDFTAFYRLRRDDTWRSYYFKLFEELKGEKDISFGQIQLRLFQHCGQVESSFSSKMLATINPTQPIWDSYVLKNLGLRLKGRTVEERLSFAVVLYDRICEWYQNFLKSSQATEMIEMFDKTFPEYSDITRIKKVDFIIWAMR